MLVTSFQFDYLMGYNILLDVNLFEWNKTDLSRKMGRCHDDPMKFISKFTFYVGYD